LEILTMTYTIDSARSIFPSTLVADAVPATVAAFAQLSPEDQLALLWFAYTEMGTTITPAALGAANMIFAANTLTQIEQMSAAEQTQAMFDLANRTDTPICRTYASFSMNVKLGFWYQLGEFMKEGIVAPIPSGYQLAPNAEAVLQTIRTLEAGQQLTVLRDVVVNMGYSPAGTRRVEAPAVPPTNLSARQRVSIAGIDNFTVLSYMETMNAFDFEAAVSLFAEDGALQPPFQRPIVGKESILAYMREECQGLKLMPEQGISEAVEGGFTQIKVTGKVQTPWFGASVGMNLAWRFLLTPQGKIFFVAIDLLASPQELINLVRG
jgi:Orange carotenoid protein, N-terminal/Nuclear transport factor 2 (NTF2) domain